MAQTQKPDTAFVQIAASEAINAYRKALGSYVHLYTGPEYVDYRKYLREGHQFWQTDELRKGTLLYAGIWYEQVPMLYDIVKDEVIIQLQNRAIQQKLISEKVEQFEWEGHTFIRLHADSLASLKSGFYELLYRNEVLVLARRAKIIDEVPEGSHIKMIFKRADSFYVQKDHTYFPINSKRLLFAVFKDRKKELQKFYRAQNLKFRKDKEKAIVALAAQYALLKRPETQVTGP